MSAEPSRRRSPLRSSLRPIPFAPQRRNEEPQYLIKSDKTDHIAMHKGAALKKIGANDDASQKQSAPAKKMMRKELI